MVPGAAAAKHFAELYAYPASMATMELLDACPPDAAHTGPDGNALHLVPLTLDVEAEFAGCWAAAGPGMPYGTAAYASTSLLLPRMPTCHVHGTAT